MPSSPAGRAARGFAFAPMKAAYNSRWQKAREGFLRSHPLCADHLSRGFPVAASVVDHKIPHRGDSTLFWDQSNWQALCKPCHDSWKQRQEKGGVQASCAMDGLPTDPRHPWAVRPAAAAPAVEGQGVAAGVGGEKVQGLPPSDRSLLSFRKSVK